MWNPLSRAFEPFKKWYCAQSCIYLFIYGLLDNTISNSSLYNIYIKL